MSLSADRLRILCETLGVSSELSELEQWAEIGKKLAEDSPIAREIKPARRGRPKKNGTVDVERAVAIECLAKDGLGIDEDGVVIAIDQTITAWIERAIKIGKSDPYYGRLFPENIVTRENLKNSVSRGFAIIGHHVPFSRKKA